MAADIIPVPVPGRTPRRGAGFRRPRNRHPRPRFLLGRRPWRQRRRTPLQAATMTTAGVDTERVLRRLEALGSLLDSRFRLPGGFRFGLDPLIGLVPGI